ncbi:hypothetical protein [Microvirga zambiensis]|uniref:hypothetical protein n=1 Tax=Microvirga zambiensis TaxID=1402137 RepID=UPI00191E4BA0|nr:hypothetical protein [Microvirga zambiensis]
MSLNILSLISAPKLSNWLEALFAGRQPIPVKVSTRPRQVSRRLPLAGIFTLGCLITIAHEPAHAQGACGPRDKLVEALSDQYKESPVGIGLAQSGQVLEVFASSSGSWSMVMTASDGKTCIIAAGDNWEMITKIKGTGI